MGKNYNQNRKQTSQDIICLTGLFLQSPYKHANLAKKESAPRRRRFGMGRFRNREAEG